MAGCYISLVLDAVRQCGPSAKLTLLALADRARFDRRTPADEMGVAFPSLRDIAERTERQERQVRDDMRVLEEHGWIIAEGSRKGGRNRPIRYRLNIAAMLNDLSPENAALHLRVLRRIPGAVPPGYQYAPSQSERINPAPNGENPALSDTKPGAAAQETRHSTAAEPVLTVFQPGLEPGAAARIRNTEPRSLQSILNPVLKRINGNGEPEGRPADDERQRMHEEVQARKKLPIAEQMAIAKARLAKTGAGDA